MYPMFMKCEARTTPAAASLLPSSCICHSRVTGPFSLWVSARSSYSLRDRANGNLAGVLQCYENLSGTDLEKKMATVMPCTKDF